MTITTTLARQLTEIVGAQHVLADPADCAAYAVQGVVPRLVVAPGSSLELAEVLALAFATNAAVIPWGGGTSQSLGQRPVRADLVLRTTRLNRVLAYEPADLTISVEAGMPMAELYATLARNNQMLPVDVACPAQATVGGVLATARDGPRCLGYGTLRDLLIGIQVVEATGRISKAGGMVVKNVSGFDMMKLYLGSLGSLAVIASANFKLIPRPRAAATVWCRFATPTAAFALADAIHASQLHPVAVEYLSGWSDSDLFESGATNGLGGGAGSGLAILAEGLPAAVERHIRDLKQMAEQTGAQDIAVFHADDHTAFWTQIADLPQTAVLQPGELVLRLSCLPGDLVQAVCVATALTERHSLKLRVDARALSGVAYLRLHTADSATGNFALQACYRALSRSWPHLTILAAPTELQAGLPIWGQPPAGLDLMQRIKQEFDPQDILNPGRFVV